MWRIILKTLVCVLLLCGVLAPAAVAKGNAVKLPGGMSITLPDNWRVQPKEAGAPLFMAVALDDKEQPFGMVMVNQVELTGQEDTLTQDKLPALSAEEKAAFLAEMEENFRSEFSGQQSPLQVKEVLDASIKNINGFHAASITASLNADGNEVMLEADIIMFADRAVQLQIWCASAQYKTHGREVAEIINSFVAGKR